MGHQIRGTERVWICVLQADGQSGSHARPARGGEWMQVLEPSRLAPSFSAGNPRLGSRQHSVETWWVLGNGSTFNELLHIREDRSLMMLPECNNAESFTSCHVIVDNKLCLFCIIIAVHCCPLQCDKRKSLRSLCFSFRFSVTSFG